MVIRKLIAGEESAAGERQREVIDAVGPWQSERRFLRVSHDDEAARGRALEQLRRSRTKVTSPTGVPTLPNNVAGVPIVITDSLSNAEA